MLKVQVAAVLGVQILVEPAEQLSSETVPAAKWFTCCDPVELNSARLVEIESAASVPTAPMAASARRRRQLVIT
ncbi:MAG: hypothetical protein WA809_10525 [Candidatus Dormiibacterota bacterium]